MRRFTKTLMALCGALLLTLPSSLGASEMEAEQEPKLETILSRYVEAVGGTENLAALTTLKKSGLYIYNGLEHPMEELLERPAKRRFQVDGLQMAGTSLAPGKQFVQAYDGETAWRLFESRAAEPEVLTEAAEVAAIDSSDFDGPLVGASAKGNAIRLVGRDEVEGQEAFHLEVTRKSGAVEQWYLSTETYLPVKKSVEVTDPRAFFSPFLWLFDDYREVGGVMIPHYIFIEEKVFSRELVFDRMEANVELDGALFAPPATPES